MTGRFLALTMPLVTVPDRPSGEPIAMHRVADDDAVGVAERQRRQVLGVHPEHRQVVARGGARATSRGRASCRR